MARAVNQNVAWIVAVLLSLMVFGAGLAVVFSLNPKRKDAEEHAASSKGSHGSAHHEEAAEEASHEDSSKNSLGTPAEHSAEKSEVHGKALGKPEEAEEKEITAASLKDKAPGHDEPVPEAKPHH